MRKDDAEPIAEPVLEARRGKLARAEVFLTEKGIRCRTTRPRKAEGLLKVARSEAERARQILIGWGGHGGRVMGKTEAAWFFCHACEEPLGLGTVRCPRCGTPAGDFHGK